MANPDSKKRKREDDPPRVTFTTPSRSFERLLKESSLESLRVAVARKLGIDGATPLEFSQVRDGKQIDLEDDDDFEAFESYAASNRVAEVRVKILNSTDQGADVRQAPTGPLAGLGPPFEVSQQAHLNLGIVSPVSQTNGHVSSLKEISSTSLGRTVASKAKQKRVPKPKTGSDMPATVQPSVDSLSSIKEVPVPGKRKAVGSRKTNEGSGVADAETEGANDTNTELGGAPQDDGSAQPQEEREVPATAAPETNGDEKKKRQKKSKTGGSATQTSNVANMTSSVPTIPSISPTVVAVTSTSEVLPVDQKIVVSKSQGELESRDQSSEGQQGSPESEKIENEKQTVKERKETQDGDEAAVTGAPKSRKRKVGPEDKPADEDASTTTASKARKRKPLVTNESNNDRDSASNTLQPPPSKPSMSKKKTKPTEEERSQFRANIDRVITDVLAKRVSASSRQSPLTAPVTTPVSSETYTGSSRRLSAIDAEESATVKPKGRKKLSRQEDTETSSVSGGNTARDAPPQRKTSPDIDVERLKTVEGLNKRLESHHDTPESTGILQANRKFAVAVQRVAQEISQQDGNSASKQPKTSGIQSFAPSGSDISEMISRHEGESINSDSDSISGFSDNSEVGRENTVTLSDTQKHQMDVVNSVPPDTVGTWDSPFAIDDVASLDVDALLNPQSNHSWRDILSTVQDDHHDTQEQLMSELGEEEEEETEFRSPRNSLLRRRTPSSSYDEDDGTPEGLQDIAPTEGAKISSRESSNDSEIRFLYARKDGEVSTLQSRAAEANRESAGIEPGREGDAHVASQLPSLKDINIRGESVAGEASIDLVVQQAMEEDDTLYLTGLSSQVSGKLQRPQEARSERIVALSQDSIAEVGRHGAYGSASQSLKEPADKNSLASPVVHSAKTAGINFNSSSRVRGARSTSECPRLPRERIERVRGRNARVVDAKQVSGPEPSQNNPSSLFDDLDVSQLVATSTHVDERRQHDTLRRSKLTAPDQSEGANRTGLSFSQPLEQRNVTTPSTTPVRTAKIGHKAQDAFRVSSNRKDTQETSESSESSAGGTKDDGNTASRDIPRNKLGIKAPIDCNASSVRGGPATRLGQSVDDYSETKNKAFEPPCTQLGKDSPSPEHHTSSDSSGTEDSESEDEDADQDSLAAQASSTTQVSLVADRSLTDIANRRDLFSRTSTPRPSFAADASSHIGLEKDDDENDSDQDDSSSSSSSSNSNRDSRIPEGKRAGYTASQSKARRLLKTIFHFP